MFEQLATEFELPRTDFYRYLQIRSFLFKQPNWKMLKSSPSAIETLLINVQNGNKILRPISHIYRALEDMKKDNTHYIKLKWEEELKVVISDENWAEIHADIHRITCSRIWRE